MSESDGAAQSYLRVAGGVLSGLIIAATFGVIALCFRYGIDHGDYGKLVPGGEGIFVNSVCGILSIKNYGTGRYVCALSTTSQMQSVGLDIYPETLNRFGKTLDQWLNDTAFLNSAVEKAFALSPDGPSKSLGAIGWGSDAGYMDFVQFSFLLFGHKIEALYYAYFLLLIVSTALFCIQFSKNYFALFTILASQFTIFASLALLTPYFDGVYSQSSPRFISVLAIIPLLQGLFLIVYRVPISWSPIALFAPQAILLVAALDFRAQAYGEAVALIICCVPLAAFDLWFRKGTLRLKLMRFWPAAVLLVGLAGGEYLESGAADPSIDGSGGMRTHTFWEPLYYDLQHHPDWTRKVWCPTQWANRR